MEHVSYSQNQEDVLLALALQDIEVGFYVDIGAGHPEIDSVTRYFYDSGWSGINIEPELESFSAFKISRLRDVNLNCAAGSTSTKIKIYKSSTPGRHSLNSLYANFLGGPTEEQFVEQLTLTSVFDQFLPRNQIIHFLKIDVEGSEKSVLHGLDLLKYRPWIIVVESLNPVTLEDESDTWENQILRANYKFAHFDGLNKYYLEANQSHREKYLRRVNVLLADFTSNHSKSMKIALHETIEAKNLAERQALRAQQETAELREEVLRAQQEIISFGADQINYELLLNSKTFRYTKFIRKIYWLILFFTSQNIHIQIKLVKISQYLKRFPLIRKKLIQLYFIVHLFLRSFKTKRNRGKISKSGGAIRIANSNSMERSFQLNKEEF